MMIKKFILTVMGTVLTGAACEMILPDGSIKKYFRLTMGFIMMSILTSPITNRETFEKAEFDFDYNMTEEEMLAESEAYVLKIHRENIEKRVKEICGNDVNVFAEVYGDGRVRQVKIRGRVEYEVKKRLEAELGCENIEVISGDESEN